jgi:hypothetical protein
MSERDQYYAIALGAACLAFAAIAFVGWSNFNSYQAQHANERQKVAEYQAHQISETVPICSVPTVCSEYAAGALAYEKPKASEHPAYFDLKAQQDMSEWTYSLLWVGVLGLIATVVGIGFVYENLREMRAQTGINREIGENQVRAFVHASSATLFVSGQGAGLFGFAPRPTLVGVQVKNTGNSPAFAVDAKAKLYVRGLGDKEDEINMDLDQSGSIDALAPGSPGDLTFILSHKEYGIPARPTLGNALAAIGQERNEPVDPMETRNALMPLFVSKSVICRGRIQYRDIFGDEFESEFEFSYFGVPSEGDKPMFLRSKGLRLFHKIKSRNDPSPKTNS